MSRTSGRHGSGQIGEQMGAVSGFVLAAAGEPTLYIAGDTRCGPPSSSTSPTSWS